MKVYIILSAVFVTATFGDNISPQENYRLVKAVLENYEKEVLPSGANGTGPTEVAVNIYIRSLSVDQNAMTWNTQLTFRMQWQDSRLQYNRGPRYITVPSSLFSKLYIPDLFFSNEIEFKRHDGLVENSYFRIFSNGEVLYSSRISLKLSCPMDFKNFPFSTQTCTIRMASYGYTTSNLIFNWKLTEPVQITSYLFLPGLSLSKFTTDHCDSQKNTGTYSCIRAVLVFKQESFTYIMNTFVPMIASIFVIWLSTFFSPVDSIIPRMICYCFGVFYCKWISSSLFNIHLGTYLMAFDCWNFWVNIFILLALVQMILANRLSPQTHNFMGGVDTGTGKFLRISRERSWGDRVDFVMKIVYPILFAFFVFVYFLKYNVNEDE